MVVSLRESRKYTITDFSGGLNTWDNKFRINDNQSLGMKNIDLKTAGSIKVRDGTRFYADLTYGDPIGVPIVNGTRYITKSGDKQIVLAQYDSTVGIKIYRDKGNGKFDKVDTVVGDRDYLGITQWRDILLYGSRNNLVKCYKANMSPEVTLPVMSGTLGNHGITNSVLKYGGLDFGGNLDYSYGFAYRFTFDIYIDDIFVGETAPLGTKSPIFVRDKFIRNYGGYLEIRDGYTTEDYRTIVILKDGSVSLPGYIKGINVYRSLGFYPWSEWGSPESEEDRRTNLWMVGYISAEDYNAASDSQVVFTDNGISDDILEVPINYDVRVQAPRAKFYNVYKNRLVCANLIEPDFNTGEEHLRQSRIAISEYDKPLQFRHTSWLDVASYDTEEITGLWNWKNKLDVVFKENSMWAMTGLDTESIEGLPNLALENISMDIGCVAPKTIVEIEGKLVWLSARGVYYFDGTVPKSLKSEYVDSFINRTPVNQRKFLSATAIKSKRQYILMYADQPDSNYNYYFSRYALVFDFYTKSWSRDYFFPGVGVFINIDKADEKERILYGVDDNGAVAVSRSSVMEINIGASDQIALTTPSSAGIAWSFQTPFYSCGSPYSEKDFQAILLDAKSTSGFTVDVLCDERLDTSDDSSGFSVPVALPTTGLVWGTGLWGTGKWSAGINKSNLVYLDDRCWGKRISFKFSGVSGSGDEINSLTLFYKLREGVRQ